jgi:hypothetical protein
VGVNWILSIQNPKSSNYPLSTIHYSLKPKT